ncbi:MAG: 2-oxoglutarate and iron-dependent oxygenase domain-containing protein [Rhodospirillaceae bacterium]
MPPHSPIPTVDLRNFTDNPAQFGKELGQAWTETGFVAITNHGISDETMEKCLLAARTFFALPAAVKQRYHIAGGGGQRGYTPFGIETAKDAATPDLKEFWHVGRDISGTQTLDHSALVNIWPADNTSFKTDCLRFFESMDLLGRRLLRAVAIYLGQSPDFFEPRVANGNSILRLLHYPPAPRLALGHVPPHTKI